MSKQATVIVRESECAVQEAESLASLGLKRESNGLISWRADSKDHPRNWSTARKTFDTTVIIFLELFVTVVSTSGVSARISASVYPKLLAQTSEH
jgi:hypothetical protein